MTGPKSDIAYYTLFHAQKGYDSRLAPVWVANNKYSSLATILQINYYLCSEGDTYLQQTYSKLHFYSDYHEKVICLIHNSGMCSRCAFILRKR